MNTQTHTTKAQAQKNRNHWLEQKRKNKAQWLKDHPGRFQN